MVSIRTVRVCYVFVHSCNSLRVLFILSFIVLSVLYIPKFICVILQNMSMSVAFGGENSTVVAFIFESFKQHQCYCIVFGKIITLSSIGQQITFI